MIKDYYIYILLCDNNSYYTGIATNVEQRFQQHCQGQGAKYTRSHKPQKIALSLKIGPSRSKAQTIEYQIKQLSHQQKQALIDNPASLNLQTTDDHSTINPNQQ